MITQKIILIIVTVINIVCFAFSILLFFISAMQVESGGVIEWFLNDPSLFTFWISIMAFMSSISPLIVIWAIYSSWKLNMAQQYKKSFLISIIPLVLGSILYLTAWAYQ
jgi:hypothetical protein